MIMNEKQCKRQDGIWRDGECLFPKKYSIWIILAVLIIGYLLGVIGSYIFGETTQLHHWVIGLGGVILSLILYAIDEIRFHWWVLLLALSIGVMISDIGDLIAFDYWSYDPPGDCHWY